MSEQTSVVGALSKANTYVTIALEVAGELVPLGKWLVGSIKAIAGPGGTQTYEAVLTADAAELVTISSLANDDLDAINAELTRLGKTPISKG